MKIIDKYILKRYLGTFSVMLLLFIPIGIVIDVSEKVNKMIENKVPFVEIAKYYLDFTIYFANMLFPIFLFLSVIWFTSKLANNTEIIAILSSGISFTRFMRPYIIGATLVSLFALLMAFVLVPNASKGYNDFRYTYLKNNPKVRENQDVYRQISDDEFIYVSNFNYMSKMGYSFSLEKFKQNKLDYKILANRIRWNEEDSTYTLFGFKKRIVGDLDDQLISLEKKRMKLDFDIDDLTPVVYIAETMTLGELNKFIEKEKARGSSNINTYLVVKYRKFSLPVSAFILTIIAVAVSAMKRRGGMGVNLAMGIALAFTFIFFEKIFGVLAEASSIPPFVAVWFPNVIFGILAIYLLRNAKR
ncbi:putative permease [Flavobacterium cauense R2A-7]|uniref:Lipopolysaccharide export system permease protein n=1 Tax=Flavobacterium cauense R2A-7 TaxID=1341154 RepID=V6RZ46_9FLAO|nr:LptF/LptG family permease [Flavobacterium cauense]ESU19444.1 putative permease [Flavobacterium cauense R2A-7]KGO79841.1 membrane protein [Flavobacterium cauense R2A-7]TWI09192.1 lipopolysaccharide export system permease protein [Flavobacterium cauense R2A-7]